MPTNENDFKDHQRKLKRMQSAVRGKTLRQSAMSAMLPAKKGLEAAAPVANPPYSYPGRGSVDPYPQDTHRGAVRLPGYTQRHILRRSTLSKDGNFVRVRVGPSSEAFYAISFIHFGTKHIAANPWMERDFRGRIGEIDSRLRVGLSDRIRRAAR